MQYNISFIGVKLNVRDFLIIYQLLLFFKSCRHVRRLKVFAGLVSPVSLDVLSSKRVSHSTSGYGQILKGKILRPFLCCWVFSLNKVSYSTSLICCVKFCLSRFPISAFNKHKGARGVNKAVATSQRNRSDLMN